MFKTLDELIRFKQSRLQLLRESVVRWATGIALAAAGFQAVYSLIFAIE
jgi:hypothetical protein